MNDVRTAAALFAASQLEELGVLPVCDRLVELHHHGGLPIGATGATAARLDAYWLGREERLPEDERHRLYARTLGPAFEHLLGRLAAAITDYDAAGRDADIAWAADELRAAIGARAKDPAWPAVALLDAQLADALAILSDPEVLATHGARDAWQLLERLARLELGETRDGPRRQALAASGTVLLAWLAQDGAAVGEEVADAAEAFLTAAAMPSG